LDLTDLGYNETSMPIKKIFIKYNPKYVIFYSGKFLNAENILRKIRKQKLAARYLIIKTKIC